MQIKERSITSPIFVPDSDSARSNIDKNQSLYSCSQQSSCLTDSNTDMSAEPILKVLPFKVSSTNKADSQKCACFWQHLYKYTNLKPVDCTIVKNTDEFLKKSKKPSKHKKKEVISIGSPEFPWIDLYEELEKRKIDFKTNKKVPIDTDEEYEFAEKRENLALLNNWRSKSYKREKLVKEKSFVRFTTEEESTTPICSTASEIQEASSFFNFQTGNIDEKDEAFETSLLEEEKNVYFDISTITMENPIMNRIDSIGNFDIDSQGSNKRLISEELISTKKDVSPKGTHERHHNKHAKPSLPNFSLLEEILNEKYNGKMKKTPPKPCTCTPSSSEEEVALPAITENNKIIDKSIASTSESVLLEKYKIKTCIICGHTGCSCKANNKIKKSATNSFVEWDMPQDERIKETARQTIRKIREFAERIPSKTSNVPCRKLVVEKDKKKPLVQMKKIVTDPNRKYKDKSKIDLLKITTSNESNLKTIQSVDLKPITK